MAQLDLLVLFVDEDQLRLVLGHVFLVNLGKSRNDEQIAHAGATCCGAVDGNHAAATLALDSVGHKAFAVVDIPDMDLFVFGNIGSVQQVFINGAGAFVVQLALGGLDAVNLGLQQGAEHVVSLRSGDG